MTEGFEANLMPPVGWALDSNNALTWYVSPLSPHGGAYRARVDYDPNLQPQREAVPSPRLVRPASLIVSFWSFGSLYWCRDDHDNCDLNVYLDVDTVIGNGNEILVYTADGAWSADWTWSPLTVDLTASVSGVDRYLAFVYEGSDGAEVALDDIVIDYIPAVPQYFNYDTNGSNNSFPFNIATGKQVQLLYLPGDFNQPSAAPAGNIESLYFRIGDSYPLGPWIYTDLTIRMGQADITEFAAGDFYPGTLTTVYSRALASLSAAGGAWLALPLDTPFAYDPTRSLVVEVSQCDALGATGYSSSFTGLTGNRRIWSVAGCPFTYSAANSAVYHVGISFGPFVFADSFECGSCAAWSAEVP